MPKISIRNIAYSILAIGFFLFAASFVFFACHGIEFAPCGRRIDLENTTGPIGDYIGGVVGTFFTLASTLLVIVTLREQDLHSRRDHFVQNYFEMLKVHGSNVSAMILHNSKSGDVVGREVFSRLVSDYNQIYAVVHDYMKHILNGGLHGNADEGKMVTYLKESQHLLSLEMRLAYGYFFFGTDSYHLVHPKDDAEKLIEQEVLKLMNYNQLHFKGRRVLLGHYYRHLYQTVMLIIEEPILSEDDRYKYAKQLRAQMNDDEQLLLYYNVMAEVGQEWIAPSISEGEIKSISQMGPLARFRMIKNIPPADVIRGIKPSEQFRKEIAFYQKNNLFFFEHNNVSACKS